MTFEVVSLNAADAEPGFAFGGREAAVTVAPGTTC